MFMERNDFEQILVKSGWWAQLVAIVTKVPHDEAMVDEWCE